MEYHSLRDAMLAAAPGMAWWFRLIDDDGGAYLKSLRMDL